MTAKVRKTGNVFAKRDASQVRSGLAGGGSGIRTIGPALGTAFRTEVFSLRRRLSVSSMRSQVPPQCQRRLIRGCKGAGGRECR